jgi:peptide-methionine (R)-S-oxide reductase
MGRLIVFCIIILTVSMSACAQQPQDESRNKYYSLTDKSKLQVSDAEWRKVLSPKAYNILREKGTEPSYTGPYVHNDQKGIYHCAACGNALFSSDTKYDSHTGWPSFFRPLGGNSIVTAKDVSVGSERTEVLCARCGGHLGHVFNDGPQPTGLRYCMNGYALKFEPM